MSTNAHASYQKINSFLYDHPEFFINIASRFYGFSEAELEKYQQVIDWELISRNDAITWNENSIRRFESKLDWIDFSQTNVFANTDLLETFKDQVDWRTKDDDGLFRTVASNESIIWTAELIEKYEDRLNFYYLPMNTKIPWSEDLIDKFKHRWKWDYLMMNDSIPWTLPMLNRFFRYIDTTKFHFQANQSLTCQLDILEAYPGFFLDRAVCGNQRLPWKEKNLLTLWAEKLDWYALARNEALFENPSFFEDHLDKWLSGPEDQFEMLSRNKALPWSIPFIERYSERWDWEYLSSCDHLPWNEELIDHFENYWEWGGEYTYEITEDEDGNPLPEPRPTSTGYSTGLATNPALPWSIDFILRYQDRLDINQLAENRGVWDKAFKHYVDGTMVNALFRLL